MASYLLKKKINIFVFDFPESRLSEGEYIGLGNHEKNNLKITGVRNISLWERFMGAATTLLY